MLADDLEDGLTVPTHNGGSLTGSRTDEGGFFVDANGNRAKMIDADLFGHGSQLRSHQGDPWSGKDGRARLLVFGAFS